MSESMVERVARALVRSHGGDVVASDECWPGTVRRYRKLCGIWPKYAEASSLVTDAFRDAQTAIEAMRSATVEMSRQGRRVLDAGDAAFPADACWGAMIDEALSESLP